jgi:exodeoxyribonuclease VII small subunit
MDQPETPNFEQSLNELQQIVSQLEGGALSLERSLVEFERGVGLLRTCYRVLEEAEQKIELLIGFDAEGQPVTEPFDASASYNAGEQKAGRRRAAKPAAVKPPVDVPSDEDDGATLF